MRIKFALIFLMIYMFSFSSFCQNKGQLSIEANYGVSYNFFVKSYDEVYSPGGNEHLYLYHKNSIGTSGGFEVKYGISQKARLIGGYARTVNTKRRSGGAAGSGFVVYIDDFNLRHVNNLYTIGYERPLLRSNNSIWFDVGVLYLAAQQQEITIDEVPNEAGDGSLVEVYVQDRNKKNSGMEEAGVFAGFSFARPIGERFSLGIKTRGYFLVSTGTFEAITLTPSLRYDF